MFTLIKWLGGLVISLVLLVMLAVFLIPKLIDPNDYRDDIIALVKKETNRDLRLDGDLSVSVFPWLGVRTQGLGLSQPEQIDGDMIAVESAQLRVKLLPLLSKRVEVDTVILTEPLLRIVTLKNGVDSFAGLTDDEDVSDEPSEQESDQGESSDVAIVIEGVEVRNAQVIIDDQSEGRRHEIKSFNLITGNLLGAGLADVNASGVLRDSSSPDEIAFNLTALAKIDTKTLQAQMVDASLEATISDNKIVMNIEDLLFSQPGLLEVNGLGVQLVAEQQAKAEVQTITLDLDKQSATISSITLTSGEMKAVISDLVASQIVDAPKVIGSINVNEFNARPLVSDFDPEFDSANKNALTKVGMTANFEATTEKASISNLVLNLDESVLAGSAGVVNFDNPAITFDLKLNSINLDDYLPEEEDEELNGAVQAGSASDALSVPMSVFKDVNANGTFVANKLTASGFELDDIDVKVTSKNGNVTITPKASLYEGKTDGEIVFSEQGGTSTLKIQNEVDLVSLGEMLTSTDITDQLSGIGSLIIDVVVTEVNGVQSNEGTIKLQAKDGALKGIDLQSIVQKGYSAYSDFSGSTSSNEIFASSPEDETKFAEVLGTFHLKDNKISNDDFSMKAPFFRVGGKGDILLDSETLDYTVDFSVVESIKGQGGDAFDKLKGLTIPIKLTGSFESPSYSIGWSELYKSLAKQKVEDKKAELLKDKLGLEGSDTSTKGILKQLLDKEINKDSGAVDGQDSSNADAEPKDAKDQLKDNLKNSLLKGLFN